jgi:EmrB/QacA subfamily drug resistance transporter
VNAEPPSIDPRVWRTVAVVCLGPFMTQIDSTVVNVSLSTLRDQLGSTIDAAQWVISGYLLALALMLPLNGWLVERVGAKRLYLACFSAFTLASLLCGRAHTMEQLIAARVLQGIAGGLLAPMAQLMIARVAGRNIARVMSYTTIPVLFAPIVGPVLAGAILRYASWPWLFFVNLPVGVTAVTLAAVLLPRDDASPSRQPFDAAGFALMSPGLACLVYGIEQATHPFGLACLGIGLALVGTFVWHARRKGSAALIDLSIFRVRVFATGTRTQFLFNGLVYAGQLLIPLYLISGAGLSPSRAGWMLAPMGLGMLCVYPFMGPLTERFGFRRVATTGVTVALVGTLPFLWMVHASFSLPLTIACMIVRGAGQGGVGIPSISAAYSSVPKARLSVATTALNVVQRLGGPVATTGLAIVLSATVTPGAGAAGFLAAFVTLIGLHVLVLASASRLPARIETLTAK